MKSSKQKRLDERAHFDPAFHGRKMAGFVFLQEIDPGDKRPAENWQKMRGEYRGRFYIGIYRRLEVLQNRTMAQTRTVLVIGIGVVRFIIMRL
jgi:hypothetical protein